MTLRKTQKPFSRNSTPNRGILAKEIKKYGNVLKQVLRDGNAAIYSQVGKAGRVCGYEVIIIRKEEYPPSSKWGKLGWYYSSIDPDAYSKALNRFNKILAAQGKDAV